MGLDTLITPNLYRSYLIIILCYNYVVSNETLNLLAGIATSIGAIIGTWFLVIKLIAPLIKRTKKLFDTWESFIIDWAGEEAGPGRDRVPGVMERLNRIDGELKHNGGSSMKDQLRRLEKELEKADLDRRENSVKIDEIYKMVKSSSRAKAK